MIFLLHDPQSHRMFSYHLLLAAPCLSSLPSPQLGPPGGMRPNWGRGSAQMQQKKTSVQVISLPSYAGQSYDVSLS